jgi:hypothetical protein
MKYLGCAVACAFALFATPSHARAETPITVQLRTGNAVGLVAPGAESKLALVLTNTSAARVQGHISALVSADGGRQESISRSYELAARGTLALPVPLATQRFGPRTINYDNEAALAHTSGRLRFVYALPAGASRQHSDFLFGVCAHVERGSLTEAKREMLAASQIGVSVMRMGQEWAALEPAPNEWHWEKLDALVSLAVRHHLTPQMVLAYGNAYAADAHARAEYERAQTNKEPDPWMHLQRAAPEDGPWRHYVAAVVRRYHRHVPLWEIWNEPDLSAFFLGSVDDYIRMLRSAYAEIKRQDAHARVMSGGFATVGYHAARALNPDLQERVLVEANDAFDIHAYHEHSAFPTFAEAVDGELARMRARMPVTRPLYFNETGLPSMLRNEQLQAVTLVKKLTFARARGAIGYTWYDLRDDGTDTADGEQTFGLLTHDFQPKPAYAAYNELIARTRATRFSGELALDAGRYGYVFSGPKRSVMVVWDEQGSSPSKPFAVRAHGCRRARVIDLMGNSESVPVQDEMLMIRPRVEPTYIETSECSNLLDVVQGVR